MVNFNFFVNKFINLFFPKTFYRTLIFQIYNFIYKIIKTQKQKNKNFIPIYIIPKIIPKIIPIQIMQKIYNFHKLLSLTITILFFALSQTKYSWFDLYLLNTTGALCLDGSPGSYYVSRDGDPKQILLYFEGGGWCGFMTDLQPIEDCYYRTRTNRGTSKLFPTSIKQSQHGIMTNDNRNNFKGWKKIIINYCDGAGHQGYKSQPVKYKDTYLYFRGHNITIDTFDSLQQNFGLFSKAQNFVVTGSSAGGQGVYFWVNHIANLVKNGKTWALSQSAIFPDAINFNTHNRTFRLIMQNLMNVVNVQIDPPVPECIAQFPLQKVNCMFVTTLYKYVKVPQFVIQSLYDGLVIRYIQNITCIQQGSFENCNQSQRNYIEVYREQLKTFLYNVTKVNSRNGFWAVACSLHGIFYKIIYFSSRFTIPSKSDFTASYAVQNWLEGNFQKNIYIDQGRWPANQPCSTFTFFLELQIEQQFQIFIFGLIFSFVIGGTLIILFCWYSIIKKRVIQRIYSLMNNKQPLVSSSSFQFTEK